MIQKAYKITVENINDEPWHYNDIVVYADSAGEAKSKGFPEFWSARIDDYSKYGRRERDVIYTDLKARRVSKEDKILYDGEYITRERVKQKEWVKDRDEKARKLWEENPESLAVVLAGCYGSYWGANRCGYGSYLNAGHYTTEEAYNIVKGSCSSRQEEVRLLDVEEYNAIIDKEVKKLVETIEKYHLDIGKLRSKKL